MQNKRPVNLNLFTISLPITAIVSILHRLSGLLLFLFIPFLLWVLDISLSSYDQFTVVQQFLTAPIAKFIIFILLASLIYHLVAGIRHLLMDMHLGDSLAAGRIGAFLSAGISIVLIIGTGIWLWA
jgi:succinate dehydrogenase / fumarate reductase cytochrome b subunit